MTLFLPFFFVLSISAQNRAEFFKVYPVAHEEMPSWAKIMYSADPAIADVETAFLAYYKKHTFQKTIHTQNHKYWRRRIQPYLDATGRIRLPDPQTERVQFEASVKNKGRAAGWISLGPVETYSEQDNRPVSFQANIYAIDQSKTNPDFLVAGTESGGIYRSFDRALTWELCSEDFMATAIEAVQIHPGDHGIVFAAGNRRIFRSADAGATWEENEFIDGDGHVIRFHPVHPDTMFCTASNGVYRSFDGGGSWARIFNERAWDIVFHPENPSIAYLLKNVSGTKQTGFWRSDDGGISWTQITQGWYAPQSPSQAEEYGGKIAVTPAAPDRVYAALIGDSKAGDNGWLGVYRSNNTGLDWSLPAGQIGGPYQSPNITPWNVAAYSDGYHQGYYNFAIAASHHNPDKIWVGSIRLSESADGGRTFQSIGAANSQRHQWIHADIQAMLVNGDEIWIASDGGLDYSADELASHESRKFGITASDFWGFGSGWNEDVLVGGKYHNGNGAWYQTYGAGNFLHIGGVEEATGYVNPIDNRTVYTNQYWAGRTRAQRIPDVLNGTVRDMPHFSVIPNETYIESSSSGIYFDPRYAGHLVIGSESTIWKSTDGGIRFNPLYSFPSGTVHEIAISRSHPDVMYCVLHTGGFWDGSSIYRSENGGRAWTKCTDINSDRWRLEIDVHPEKPYEIWMASSRGNDNAKVFFSDNGGQTWSNRTTPVLNGHRMKDIMIQGGTDGIVYLATDSQVFYSHDGEWHPMSEGLPALIHALKLKPFYRDNKLRLATYGRGIFETSLIEPSKPLAQAMTLSDTIYCARDTVPFECYSMLDHDQATWEWTFTPEPAYVSSHTARNPQVVFGRGGAWDVSLRITDRHGNSDTWHGESMVFVRDDCSSSEAGTQVLTLQGQGDFVQAPDLGFTSNTTTISAWVYPDGIQDDYSAIYMNDDATAGFNFRGGNNTLGYHWPDGAWWWDSGLRVLPGQWSYVTMQVEPDKITLGVNGMTASHQFNVPPVAFGTGKIGSYKGWDGRNMRGRIDEVCLWNRTLSREELRLKRHLIKEGAEESDMVFYYQFDEDNSQVFDRINHHHAQLTGNAGRSRESAPVAKGRSEKLLFDAHTWSGDMTGVNLLSSLTPAGSPEVYAFKANAWPCPDDDDQATQAWIINTYDVLEDNTGATLMLEHELFVPDHIPQLWARDANDMQTDYTGTADGAANAGIYIFESGAGAVLNKQLCVIDGELQTSITGHKPEKHAVYPNPLILHRSFMITTLPGESGTVSIYDEQGRPVHRALLSGDTTHTIGLPPGIGPGKYVYQIRTGKVIQSGVLVMAR